MTDPAIALQLSCHGRVFRPRRDFDFNCSSSFLNSVLPLHLSTLQVCDYSFAHFAASLPSHANSGSSPPANQGSALPRLWKQLKESGERVFYVEKAVMSGTKPKSPGCIESSSSSSESSNDSVTPLAASGGSLPSRGKNAALPKPTSARLNSSASAFRASLQTKAPADMGVRRERLRYPPQPHRFAVVLTTRPIR